MAEHVTLIGSENILRRISYLRHDIDDPKIFNEVGLFLTFKVEARTAEGRDVHDRRFEPYSPAYKKYREDEGHSGEKVNLFFSGSMMAALTFEGIPGGVRLFFQNTSDPEGVRNPLKAFWHNTGAEPQPKRKFFALSESDRAGAIGIIDKHIRRLARKRTTRRSRRRR
jgi:hypothetical protein